MKLKTQHIRVAQGHNVFQLHREGNVTWVTTGDGKDQSAHNVIKHESIRAAKALFGDITSAGK
jgi:hypothetical protein